VLYGGFPKYESLTFVVAGSALANHAWGSYHWSRASNPFTLQVGNNVSSGWDNNLNVAISDWAASDVLNLNKVAGLAYATDELLDDAPALEAIITEALTNEIQFLVEDAIISGDGVGKPLGILNSGAVVTQAQAGGQTATFTVANAASMYGRLWAPLNS